MVKVNEFTVTFHLKNDDRKWYQIWKPLTVDREITIYDADIDVRETDIDRNGTITYTVTADTTDIANKVMKAKHKLKI